MSTASHAHSGKLSLGGLLTRIFVIILIWVGLVYGLIHYVGHVIPTQYQLGLAAQAAADLKAHEAATAPVATAPAAASAPAGSSVAPAPAAAAASASAPAAPAVAAASAPAAAPATPAPAAAAPKASGEKKLPIDVRLAGFNRTALTNVSIFFSIVASIYCLGAIILQLFKYCHQEEEAAH